MNMIERVARAILKSRFYDFEPNMYSSLEDFYAAVWPDHGDGAMLEATAAIEAMREPTEEMEVYGTEQWLCEAAMEDRAGSNWRAMIDAALNEGE